MVAVSGSEVTKWMDLSSSLTLPSSAAPVVPKSAFEAVVSVVGVRVSVGTFPLLCASSIVVFFVSRWSSAAAAIDIAYLDVCWCGMKKRWWNAQREESCKGPSPIVPF